MIKHKMWAILCLADPKSMEVEVLVGRITIKVHHGRDI